MQEPRLLGETIVAVSRHGDEEIVFTTARGVKLSIRHIQDCCESVVIHEVRGDLQSLVGQKVVKFEGTWDNQLPTGIDAGTLESYTRSIFTVNDVVIECFGQSNGYYGERMELVELPNDEQQER